jgi:hypothetical protein
MQRAGRPTGYRPIDRTTIGLTTVCMSWILSENEALAVDPIQRSNESLQQIGEQRTAARPEPAFDVRSSAGKVNHEPTSAGMTTLWVIWSSGFWCR